ncbi:MAG TPA: MBL fold metallo-hydrolase [Patescibacteria group bacterium]|nr:MBL fold metallo-hydrolase [Patescibacteria group bacterium]
MPTNKNKIGLAVGAIIIFVSLVSYVLNILSDDGQVLSGFDFNNENVLEVYFLDVGQGDSTLIRTPASDDILIDGGPDNTVIKKLGEYMPFYDWDIELMILTHPHSDHLVGLIEVLERYEVDKILMTGVLHTTDDYLTFLDIIKDKQIPVEIIDSQRQLTLGDLTINILYSDQSFYQQSVENLNNTSIVTKLVYGNTSILMMGDYEDEEKMVEANVDVSADILKVGHHGSNNGNNVSFLEAVSPKYAVILVGADNFYGHPHYRTIRNLEKLDAQIYRTDQDSDVIFYSDGQDIWR